MDDLLAKPDAPPDMPDDGLVDMIEPEPLPEEEEFEAPVCIDEAVMKGDDWEDRLCTELMRYLRYYQENEYRQRQERRWDASYNAYIGAVPNGTFAPRETLRQIETLIPQLSKAMFWAEQLFNYKARLEGFESKAQAATDIVHDQLRRHGSLKELEKAFVYDSVHFGIGYAIYGWEHFKQIRYKYKCVYTPNEPDKFDRGADEIVREAPVIRRVSPEDIYVDPTIADAKDSPFTFYVRQMSGSEIETSVRNGYADGDAVLKAIPDPDCGKHDREDEFAYLSMLPDMHEVVTAWGNGWEYVMVNDEHIIRAARLENGKTPIITAPPIIFQPGEHYGLPLAMVTLGEQRFLNEVANLYVKNCAISAIGGMVVGTPEAIKAWNNAVLDPGRGVALNNPGDLQPLNLSRTMDDCQSIMSYTTNSMSRSTGLSDIVGGTGTNGANTATGQLDLKNSALDRIQQMVHLLQPACVEAYQEMYDLNAANMDRSKEYNMRVAGPDGVEVFARYKGDVFDPADIDVEVSLANTQGIQFANFWLNVAKNASGITYINGNKIWDEVWKAAGIKRIKGMYTSGLNQQEDALKETEQCVMTGIIADPRPMDNHAMHLAIHMMALQMAQQWNHTNRDAVVATLNNHIAIHQNFLQQQQIANGMQQQAPASMLPAGATPAGQMGNDTANQMLGMGRMGAEQQGAA